MATLIQAIVRFGPRLGRRPKASAQQLAKRVALAAGMRPSIVTRVLMELEEAIVGYGRSGVAVDLPTMGTFAPTLAGDGEIRLCHQSLIRRQS